MLHLQQDADTRNPGFSRTSADHTGIRRQPDTRGAPDCDIKLE
jgi:hypothetical protein